MSSSAQIVTRAYKRLGLVEPGEDPAADMAADGLAALNAMLASWAAHGVNVSPDVPLPAKHEKGVTALLAVDLSAEYPGSLTPRVEADAADGWQALQADYISAPLATFDCALVGMPSKGQIMTATLDDWAVSTAYAEYDRVEANRRIYECIIAGTSASTGDGPHSAGPEITDGTVTWRFIGFAN
jgi:hypothetical protein